MQKTLPKSPLRGSFHAECMDCWTLTHHHPGPVAAASLGLLGKGASAKQHTCIRASAPYPHPAHTWWGSFGFSTSWSSLLEERTAVRARTRQLSSPPHPQQTSPRPRAKQCGIFRKLQPSEAACSPRSAEGKGRGTNLGVPGLPAQPGTGKGEQLPVVTSATCWLCSPPLFFLRYKQKARTKMRRMKQSTAAATSTLGNGEVSVGTQSREKVVGTVPCGSGCGQAWG